MIQDSWLDLLEKLQKTCVNFQEEILPLMGDDGEEIDGGSLQVVEFETPDGSIFRLEREVKPRVLAKHMHFSGRAGTSASMTYDVSDSEFVDLITLLQEDDYGEWVEVPLERIGL